MRNSWLSVLAVVIVAGIMAATGVLSSKLSSKIAHSLLPLSDSGQLEPEAVGVQAIDGSFTFVVDFDNDKYISASSWEEACSGASSEELRKKCVVFLRASLEGTGDCNEMDASIHPGAVEIVDSNDNDCDGLVDESSRRDDLANLDACRPRRPPEK